MANKKMTFAEAIADVKKRRELAMEEICTMVEADAKLLTPVLTGNLKRSYTHAIKSDDKKTQGSVGTTVEYAIYAERKKPHLEPAVDMNLQRIKQKITEVMTP